VLLCKHFPGALLRDGWELYSAVQFTGHGQDIHSDHSETDTYTPTTVATAVALSAYRAELL
jgi:hypothetical protein